MKSVPWSERSASAAIGRHRQNALKLSIWLLRGQGKFLKDTFQTHAPTNFRLCQWGDKQLHQTGTDNGREDYHWVDGHFAFAFLFFSFSHCYLSPRRGCPRVMKFCMGFSFTKNIRFGVKQNLGAPSKIFKVFLKTKSA